MFHIWIIFRKIWIQEIDQRIEDFVCEDSQRALHDRSLVYERKFIDEL